MTTRGLRNCNPGNIDKGQPWQGLADSQPDPRFCTFVAPEWGIRAVHEILQSYQNKYHLDTVHAIVSRWAPPSENDTEAYASDVARRCNVAEQDIIDVMDPGIAYRLTTALIYHENSGFQYPEEIVWKGLALAGVETPT